MDVDVLLWGGTHKFEAYELEGKFFVNPGSATGAFSTSWFRDGEEPTPSFCLMDVSDLRKKSNYPLAELAVGTGRCSRLICLSTKDRRKWRRKRRRRESLFQKDQHSGSSIRYHVFPLIQTIIQTDKVLAWISFQAAAHDFAPGTVPMQLKFPRPSYLRPFAFPANNRCRPHEVDIMKSIL